MKLILYHANAMMKEIAENWAKENQVEVTVLSELLTAESVKLAKGYDGIILSLIHIYLRLMYRGSENQRVIDLKKTRKEGKVVLLIE